MQDELPETCTGQPGACDQPFYRRQPRVTCLKLEEPEHCDRVVIFDPPTLGCDEPGDLVRCGLGDEALRVHSERAQVLQNRATRFLVVRLLDEVAPEVLLNTGCDGVVQLTRAGERGLHQLEHRAGDVVAGRQIPRVDLGGARVLEQPLRGQRNQRLDQFDLPLEPRRRARAGRQSP